MPPLWFTRLEFSGRECPLEFGYSKSMREAQQLFHTALFRQTDHLLVARRRLRATKPGQPLKILSFGSSIGEELVTLRYLFPEDDIFGCDINNALVEISRRSVGSLATVFTSSEEEIAAHGPYDLILASAVLCLYPGGNDFAERFPVSRFDELVELLDQNLNPGGLLIVTNASYRFTECPIAGRYTTLRADVVDSAGFVDVFNRRSRPYLVRIPASGGAVYVRRGQFVPRDDEDLADSIFEKKVEADAPAIETMRLAEPPSGLVSLRRHTRRNTDWLGEVSRPRSIEIRYDYDFCRIDGTDAYGYVLKTSWTSLVGEGFHERPPIWRLVPTLDTPAAGE